MVGRELWADGALALGLALATSWLALDGAPMLFGAADLSVSAADAGEPGRLPGAPDEGVATEFVAGLLMTVPVLGRRRLPLLCLAVQFGALLAFETSVNAASVLALLIGAYSLIVYGASVVVSAGALLVAATGTAVVKTDTWPSLPDWAGVFAIMLPVGASGFAIRAARSRAQAWRQRAEALQREQDAATQLAVAEERARIARELHDVVSHHVSVMTIQAGAAGKVLDADPELARAALRDIEASGRETMAELRQMLGVLAVGPTDDPLRPQPGLDQLDSLIDGVRRAGLPVSVRYTPVVLPRGIDLAAYRVLQEALTNVLRHAPGARTEVVVGPQTTASGERELVIEVTNDAGPPGAPRGGGAGTGLLGLAERLRVLGGTLTHGRRVGGGYQVRARVPLDEASTGAGVGG
jgi:signal transduction histidine kinase